MWFKTKRLHEKRETLATSGFYETKVNIAKLAMYFNIFVHDLMSRTNLPHILAVLTHCTCTIPLVGLEDLLKRHFPADRFST